MPWQENLVVIAAAALAVASLGQQQIMMSQKEVQVPDFQGMTLAAARSAAIDPRTQKPMFSAINSNNVAGGTVSKQDPAAGLTIPLGSRPLNLTLKGPSILDTVLQGLVTKKPSKVKVPDVVGDAASEASAALSKYKLTASYRNGNAGVVSQQSAPPGTLVDPGTPVALTLTVPEVSVPNLVGLDVPSAEARLDEASLQIGSIRAGNARQADAAQSKRTVAAQSPAAYSTTTPGSAVDVSLATAPQVITVPDEKRVPNLLGLDLARARAILTKTSLTLGTVTGSTASGSKVVLQQPLAGKPARPNDSVNLTFRAATSTVTVPDLAGETAGDAEASLGKVGLLLGNVDGSKISTVKGQLPLADSTLPRGSSVSVTMVSRPGYLLLGIVALALLAGAAVAAHAFVHHVTMQPRVSAAVITLQNDPRPLFSFTLSASNLARTYRVESEPAMQRKR